MTKPVQTIGQVQHTELYGQFERVPGNRKVSEYHITQLIRSFQAHPELIELRPVLVNDEMEVLDGQHRLEALRRMEIPVPYQVVPGGTLATIQILNGTQLPWTLIDFVRSFAEDGNEHYQTLLGYVQRNKFSVRFGIRLLGGKTQSWATQDSSVKSGKFTLREDMEDANAFLDHLHNLSPLFPLWRSDAFVNSLLRIWNHESYDPARMERKMVDRPLYPQPNRSAYVKELQDIYNSGKGQSTGSGFVRFM